MIIFTLQILNSQRREAPVYVGQEAGWTSCTHWIQGWVGCTPGPEIAVKRETQIPVHSRN
jgi:hypothetical protein